MAGEELLPIRVLAEKLVVNPNTIARAYRELELAGIVEKRRTAGTFVTDQGSPLARRERMKILTERIDQLLAEALQMDQLSQNLQQAFPDAGWEKSYNFSGQDPLNFAQAAELMQELGDLDQLENLLRGASSPGALAEVDIERARQLLGDEAAQSLENMARIAKMLEDAGLIENREGKMELTPQGIRRIGQNALRDLFSKMKMDQVGRHAIDKTGWGHERDYSTKPY